MIPRYPFPSYPRGWFALGFSDELRPGDVTGVRLADRELVLFRTERGHAAALDAHCPHMGANLACGGAVVGESVRCPFHAFRFDRHGACVGTGYGDCSAPRVRTGSAPVAEVNGIVLAWFDPSGAAPAWEIPDVDTRGWSPLARGAWTVRSHPQETSENSVDLGHFAVVHGYRDVELIGDVETDGPILRARYRFSRAAGAFGNPTARVDAEVAVEVRGLGYSFVDVRVPAYELRCRSWILATPLDQERVQLRAAMRTESLPARTRVNPALGLLTRSLATGIVNRMIFFGASRDLRRDFAIWENKSYVERPALARGDGPISTYRRWARQFYVRDERRCERPEGGGDHP